MTFSTSLFVWTITTIFDVQENAMLLDDVLKTELYWQNFDESFVELLDTKVRPLMKRHQTTFAQDKAMQFEIITTQYEIAELDKQLQEKNNVDTKAQNKKIELLKNKIRKSIFEWRTTIYKVKEKSALIEKVKSSDFAKNFNYKFIRSIARFTIFTKWFSGISIAKSIGNLSWFISYGLKVTLLFIHSSNSRITTILTYLLYQF